MYICISIYTLYVPTYVDIDMQTKFRYIFMNRFLVLANIKIEKKRRLFFVNVKKMLG